jgi:hypothetical protein
MMSGKGGSTLSFVYLPEDIHFEIAKAIDPMLCSDPSSFHALDSEHIDLPELYRNNVRPNRTLATLTRVCKQLRLIYAPFSTWRSLYIEAKDLPKLSPSPSLTRVLKYPDTGIYVKQLFIHYRGLSKEGLFDALTRGSLVDLTRFLANTPRLDTVRCMCDYDTDVRLPIDFFASLSPLASLRYIFLGIFDMDSEISPSFPSLHQVRILRCSRPSGPFVFGDLLRFSMPNIHTLYAAASRVARRGYYVNYDGDSATIPKVIVDGIQVRPLFPRTFLSLTSLFFGVFFS